ncbi:MAG: recombination protein RecR [Lentisphaerae bacterium]|nr:recombination protein RecR [Lentisphaerota bacterium]
MIEAVDRLVSALAKLPGLGRRSAERIALRLVRDRGRGTTADLISALQGLESQVRLCSTCGAMTPADRDPCRICTDPRRETRSLCVVEDPSDIASIEASGAYQGRYHALMGRLSPMRGEGPRQLRVEALVRRIGDERIEEVILALNTDAESESTAQWLASKLAALGVKVSRIAYGLPVGSGIAYSDPVTLQRAIAGRMRM